MRTYFDDVNTLYENFQRGIRVSSKCAFLPPNCASILCMAWYADDGPCLGERVSPTGPYEWLSYGEVEKRAVAFGAGLSALGLEPGPESHVGIYSKNNIKVRGRGVRSVGE